MAKDLFPLPTLGKKLEERCQELHFGRGVTILRGLEPEKYSATDNVLLFVGLSCYFGEKRACQDKFGNLLSKFIHDSSYYLIEYTDPVQHILWTWVRNGVDAANGLQSLRTLLWYVLPLSQH